jgi:hypothetical protein
MSNKIRFGMLVLTLVFGMLIVGCDENKESENETPPEQLTEAERWRSWSASDAKAIVNYSVGTDNVCTIIYSGTEETSENRWKANARYDYTGEKDKSYIYKFEAWTQTGERTIGIQYFDNAGNGPYLNESLSITNTRKEYTIIGVTLPTSVVSNLQFLGADQLGTFYVKILSINAYNGAEDLSTAERWTSFISPPTTTTINHSVDNNGVCAITVGGTVDTAEWRAVARYSYSGKKNTNYTYEFEAWTDGDNRYLNLMSYGNGGDNWSTAPSIEITSERTTYTVEGKDYSENITQNGIQKFGFRCADQTGVFYVKILSIDENDD